MVKECQINKASVSKEENIVSCGKRENSEENLNIKSEGWHTINKVKCMKNNIAS